MLPVTLYRLIIKKYMYKNEGRLNIIKKILDFNILKIKQHLNIPDGEKFTCSDLKFKHLRKLIKLHPTIYKHFLLNTLDLSRSKQIYITSMEKKWDDIYIIDALMASSAIPFVFDSKKMYYNSVDDTYSYDESNGTKNSLVDGGVSMNNPIGYFINKNLEDTLSSNNIDDKLSKYKFWVLKFDKKPKYINIDTITEIADQVLDSMMGTGDDLNIDFMEQKYNINTINLHLTAKTLTIYTQQQIQDIISKVYDLVNIMKYVSKVFSIFLVKNYR